MTIRSNRMTYRKLLKGRRNPKVEGYGHNARGNGGVLVRIQIIVTVFLFIYLIMEKTHNNIPIEGILKWLKKDRDELQSKLNQLVPYTKSLEKKIVSIEKELADYRKQLSLACKETSKTEMYKTLNRKYTQLKKDNKQLLEKIGSLYRKLEQYEKTK